MTTKKPNVRRTAKKVKPADESLNYQQYYRALFDQFHDGVFILDLEGRHVDANERAAQMLGYSREELKRLATDDTSAKPEDSRRVRERLLRGEQIPAYERLFLKKSGETIPLEINVELVLDEAGNPLHIQSVVRDITERKRSELELSRRADELTALYEITKDLSFELDVGKLLDTIVQRMNRLLESSGGFIYLYDRERNDLVLTTVTDSFVLPVGTRLKIGEGMAGRVADSRKPMIVDDYHAWEGRAKAYENQPLLSVIEVPMLSGGELIGVLGVEVSKGSSRKFNESDARLLSLFAGYAAGAVRNARLLETLQRELAERKQAEESLRTSEEKIQNIIRHSSSLFYTHTSNHLLTYVSPQSREILDCEPQEAMVHWQDFLSDNPINQAGVESTMRAIRTGERQPPYELELITRKGRKIWVEVDESPASVGGSTSVIVGSLTDITERKRVEHELESRVSEFSALYEAARSLAGETDLQKVLQTILDQAVSLLNTSNGTITLYDQDRDELVLAAAKNFPITSAVRRKLGQGMAGITAQTRQPLIVDDYNSWAQRNPDLAEAGLNAAIEVPLIYHDELIGTLGVGEAGTERKFNETDVRFLALIGAHAAGAVENARLFQFLQSELNERRQAENALAESETRYRSLVDQLPAIVYLDDLQTDTPTTRLVSPRIQDFLGIPPEEWLAGGFEIWKESIHPDDLERALSNYFESIENSSFYSQEYRMVARDGRTFWARDTATIQRNERGEPINMQGVIYDITEAKGAESTLRLQSAALEAAVNAIVITDMNGTIQWVNPAYTSLTGYETWEAVGKNLGVLSSDMHGKIFFKEMWNTILSGKPWRGEMINRRKDGMLYHEEQSITPLLDSNGVVTHFIAIKQDITSRKQTEEKILKQLGHIAALREIDQVIASSFDMQFSLKTILTKIVELLQLDAATVLLLNQPAGTLEFAAGLGFRSRTLESASVTISESYAGKAITDRTMVQIPDLTEEPENKFETGFLKDEGFVTYCAVPLIIKGQVLGVLEVFHRSLETRDEEWFDVLNSLAGQATIAMDNARLFNASQHELVERKRAEDQLRRSHAELEKRIEERTADLRLLNDELERALRVKDEFLANMSHELRTPLNAVIGLSDSLTEQTAGTLNEKQQKYVSTIRESGQHLLDLINDILDLAKIEAGQTTLERRSVNVSQVCESSLRMVKELAKRKKQEISFEPDPGLRSIYADERRLKQMIVNLLSNAVKFTPENGRVGLQVRGDRVNNTVHFTVWDSGIGIAENDLPHLFKPFVQLDSNLARQSAGTGLGLSLVAKMAALHGGSVSVESQPGQGSRFTITLPWEQPAKTGPLSSASIVDGASSAIEPKGQTILLVDDTEDIIQLFKEYLEYSGYKVVVARNGVEGVTLAEETLPNLILMDIQMPVMNGLEAARRIRLVEALKWTPIIALTALAMKGDRERCLEAGMDDYLSKPISPKVLLDAIRNHLSYSTEVGDTGKEQT